MEQILYPFQIIGTKFLAERRGALLADVMGLGKSVQAVCAARQKKGPILIIVRPLNMRFWISTIRQWDDPNVPIKVCGPAGAFDADIVKSWFAKRQRGYLIVHHEALRYAVKVLQAFGIWEVIIADEAHKFRNRKAQMTKCLKQIPSYYRWALTGTPFDKQPNEFWSVMNWLNPAVFSAYWRFFEEYVELDKYTGKVKGPKNVEVLATTLSPYYLRRTKEEVLPQLPPKMYRTIELDMTKEQAAIYKKVEEETLVNLTGDPADTFFIGNILSRIAHLRKVALDPMLIGVDVEGVKIQWITEWIDLYDVPFAIFVHSREYANSLGVCLPHVGVISGSVSQSDRDKVLADFNSGKLRGIVGTIDTMSESINLQRARVSIFMELHWSSIMMDQAENRIHRMNSPDSVEIIRLICPGTVDELILEALRKKWSDRRLVEAFLKMKRQV